MVGVEGDGVVGWSAVDEVVVSGVDVRDSQFTQSGRHSQALQFVDGEVASATSGERNNGKGRPLEFSRSSGAGVDEAVDPEVESLVGICVGGEDGELHESCDGIPGGSASQTIAESTGPSDVGKSDFHRLGHFEVEVAADGDGVLDGYAEVIAHGVLQDAVLGRLHGHSTSGNANGGSCHSRHTGENRVILVFITSN